MDFLQVGKKGQWLSIPDLILRGIQVILEGHTLASFLQQHFDFSTPKDAQKSQFIQQIEKASDKHTVLQDIVTTIMLKEYVNTGTYPLSDVKAIDGVFIYAKEVLSLACFSVG